MGKFISSFFLWALAIVLSVFTASRTLDLLAWALPSGQEIYQWLGLASFEGSMWFWSFYFVHGAKGTYQRGIAIIMSVFSIVGVCIALVSDLLVDASQTGKLPKLPPEQSQAVIIFLGVVIALNVAAFIACKLLSIDNLRLMKEQDAEDVIHNAGLTAITSLAPAIAADAAPHLATEWANRTWQRLVPGVGYTQYLGPAQQTAQIAPPVQAQQSIDTSKTIDADKSIDAPKQSRKAAALGVAQLPKQQGKSWWDKLFKKEEEEAPVFTSVYNNPKHPAGKMVRQSFTHTVPLSPIAQQRMANRQQRLRPTTQLVPPKQSQDEGKGTVQPPLSQQGQKKPVDRIAPKQQPIRNQGAYTVNHDRIAQRKGAPMFPTND